LNVLDGRAMAADMAGSLAARTATLRESGIVPRLAVVASGAEPAVESYVRMLERGAKRVGVNCATVWLPATTDARALGRVLDELSADPVVHGVLLQTPLPAGIAPAAVAAHLSPDKDVDGLNPLSAGRLQVGQPGFVPATAAAIMEILRRAGAPLTGAEAVVVGRSLVVGRPVAHLLLQADATVTICHSRTRSLAEVCRRADVLVVAAGRAGLIGPDAVRPGAIVVDAGTNATGGGLAGDVDFEAVAPVAGAITPVPGGVGPVTTMALLRQTVDAAARGVAVG